METRTEVRTFKVQYKCPKCEQGHLEFIGTRWVFNIHKCDNKECGHHEKFSDKKYPFIEYEMDKIKSLHATEKGYIVTEIDGIKFLLYGFPTGNGDMWQCYDPTPRIAEEQQSKVKLKDIYFQHEVEIKEVAVSDTIHTQKIAYIKSLM